MMVSMSDIDFDAPIRRAGEIEDEDRRAARVPRQPNGRPLHLLGTGYSVLVDRTDGEVSERSSGSVWIGFTNDRGSIIMIVPDETDADGRVSLVATSGECVAAAIGLDGDGILFDQPVYARRGGSVSIDWTTMLETHMA